MNAKPRRLAPPSQESLDPRKKNWQKSLNDLLSRKQVVVTAAVVRAIQEQNAFAKWLIPNGFPKEFAELGCRYMSSRGMSLPRMLKLLTGICLAFSDELSNRVQKRNACLKMILTGEHESAAETICDMAGSYKSIVLIELQMHAVYESSSLNGLRDLQDRLLDQLGDQFIKYLVGMIAAKVDSSLSAAGYISGLAQMLSTEDVDKKYWPLYAEARFRTAAVAFDTEFLSNIADASRRYSIDDIYSTLKRLLLHCTAASEGKKHAQICKECILALVSKIDDQELLGLHRLSSPNSSLPLTSLESRINRLDELYYGITPLAFLKECCTALRENPEIFELYVLYASASLDLGQGIDSPFQAGTSADEILSLTFAMIGRQSKFTELSHRFHKLSYTLDGHGIGLSMFRFYLSTFGYRHYLDTNALKVCTAISSVSEFQADCRTLPEEQEIVTSIVQDRLSRHFVKVLFESNRKLGSPLEIQSSFANSEQRSLIEVLRKIVDGEIAEAKYQADTLYSRQAHTTSTTQELARIRLLACTELDSLLDAIACIAELFVKSPQRLPGDLQHVVAMVVIDQEPPSIDTCDKIDFALTLCAAQHLGYDIKDYRVYAAYDQLLKSLSLKLPTDLLRCTAFLQTERALAFLFYCCKIQYIKSSKYITSTSNLESERLQILQYIQANSSEFASECRHEISQLSKNATLREALLQVAASKVYVNVDLVIAGLPNDFVSEFDRFVRYAELENIHGKRKLRDDSANEIGLVISFANDAFKLYVELFDRVREAFVFSKAGGLQTYLSMRVRHGSLEAHLRGQLEKAGLMTRLLDDGSYAQNDVWEDELGIVSPQIASMLADFAKSFDSLVRRVNTDWISVVREGVTDAGMFDFRFSPEDLATGYLTWRILGNKAYEQFLRHCFKELWARTEVCLARIRERISSELRVDLVGALFTLQEKVEGLDEDALTRVLRAKIAMATTQLQHDIASLAGWFNAIQSNALPSFDLVLLFDTCLQIAKKVYPKTLLDLQPSISSDVLIDGRWFNAFVDVLDILLLNAVRYSPQEDARLVLKMNVVKDELTFSIRNKMRTDIDVAATKVKASELSTDSGHFSLEDRVQVEGKSGYSKLWNVLTTELACIGFSIQCSVENESEFVASVTLRVSKYLLGANGEGFNSRG